MIRGIWGVGGFLVLDLVVPIMVLPLLSFCFRGLAFGGTLYFGGWGREYLSEP